MLGFLPIVAMFGIMYFLVLLPAQRQRKQLKEMLANLKNGDEVVTNGGIIGTIVSMNSEDQSIWFGEACKNRAGSVTIGIPGSS